MLRVGLTGGLGSGKSTVAAMLRELGARVIEADALGRELMEPGQPVFAEIVRTFGPGVVDINGRLNRAKLAELAFQGGRLNELNAIVHPAAIRAQQQWMDKVVAADPAAVAVVESALIFEVERDARARGETETVLADWRRRFDSLLVVTAPDEVKVARYAARTSQDGSGRAKAEAEARLRLAHQIPDAEKAAKADYVIENVGDIADLSAHVTHVWTQLKAASNKSPNKLSLE
jgi:dephospho-CoA kinase